MVNEIDFVLQECIRRYFSLLRKRGYVNYNSVYKIMLLSAIQELLKTDLVLLMNECDKKTIDEAVNKLYCSICLIPNPIYRDGSDITVLGKTEDNY